MPIFCLPYTTDNRDLVVSLPPKMLPHIFACLFQKQHGASFWKFFSFFDTYIGFIGTNTGNVGEIDKLDKTSLACVDYLD